MPMLLLLQDPGAAQPAEWREIRQVDRGEGQRGPRGGLLLQVGEGQYRPRGGLLLQVGEGQRGPRGGLILQVGV